MKTKVVQIRLTDSDFEKLNSIVEELDCDRTEYLTKSAFLIHKLFSISSDEEKLKWIESYKNVLKGSIE